MISWTLRIDILRTCHC